jgi:hypothetical protein
LKARNKVLNLQLRDVPKHPSTNAVYVNGQLVNGIDKENIDPEQAEEKIDDNDGTQV